MEAIERNPVYKVYKGEHYYLLLTVEGKLISLAVTPELDLAFELENWNLFEKKGVENES